jgi:hypothetical protein
MVMSRPDRRAIPAHLILSVMQRPSRRQRQPDGREQLWGDAGDGRWLRVVLLEDGKTVHHASLDRGFTA